MKKLTQASPNWNSAQRRIARAIAGQIDGTKVTFTRADLFTEVMTARRWEIIRGLLGAGPLSISEVARRVRRRAKNIRNDIEALVGCGVLVRDEDNRLLFPFDAVHVDVRMAPAV